ncbi:hypothetical protein HDV00_000498 [Rhizophlyctis rosea]|nr:hypothetical protein HDV00_000498 [Rhizophlyctis rosea]
MVESLRAKGVLSDLWEDLKGSSSRCFAVADEHIRSLVRAEAFRKSPPLELLKDLCAFGLEDFVGKLVEEFYAQREDGDGDVEPQFVVDGSNLASFVPVSLAYDELDLDMVLVQPPTPWREGSKVELVLGSYKLARSALMKKHPQEFCARNVLKFLQTKVPSTVIIERCIVVGLSLEETPVQEDRSEQERKMWDDALSTLRTGLPTTQFEARVWSLSMVLHPLRNPDLDTQSPYPTYGSSSTIADNWPILERPEFRDVVHGCLEQGRSLLVRGFAGVGKTVYTRRLIQDWVNAQPTPPKVHMVDVFTLLR